MAGPTDGSDITRARNALELGFGGACDLLQGEAGALRIRGPEGKADDRDIIDPLGLDQRRAHTQLGRQPVGMRMHGVVQAHQGSLIGDTDLELNGDDGHPRA